MFWSTGCSLLRAEGFSCILDVLYGGIGIRKLQYLISKKLFFKKFLLSKPPDPDRFRIRIRIDLQCRIRIETKCGSETLLLGNNKLFFLIVIIFLQVGRGARSSVARSPSWTNSRAPRTSRRPRRRTSPWWSTRSRPRAKSPSGRSRSRSRNAFSNSRNLNKEILMITSVCRYFLAVVWNP